MLLLYVLFSVGLANYTTVQDLLRLHGIWISIFSALRNESSFLEFKFERKKNWKHNMSTWQKRNVYGKMQCTLELVWCLVIHDMTVTVEIQNEVNSMSNNLSNILLRLLKQINIFIYTFLPGWWTFFNIYMKKKKTIKIYIIWMMTDTTMTTMIPGKKKKRKQIEKFEFFFS